MGVTSAAHSTQRSASGRRHSAIGPRPPPHAGTQAPTADTPDALRSALVLTDPATVGGTDTVVIGVQQRNAVHRCSALPLQCRGRGCYCWFELMKGSPGQWRTEPRRSVLSDHRRPTTQRAPIPRLSHTISPAFSHLAVGTGARAIDGGCVPVTAGGHCQRRSARSGRRSAAPLRRPSSGPLPLHVMAAICSQTEATAAGCSATWSARLASIRSTSPAAPWATGMERTSRPSARRPDRPSTGTANTISTNAAYQQRQNRPEQQLVETIVKR